MVSGTTEQEPEDTTGSPPTWIGITGLQCELRHLFLTMPAHRALGAALRRVAQCLHAHYAVVHARFGSQLLSEEWVEQGTAVNEETREVVTQIMWEASSEGAARCRRLTAEGHAIAAALMYDQDVEETGAAAILFKEESREQAVSLLAQFESIMGFLAVLLTGEAVRRQAAPSWGFSELAQAPNHAAEHPVHLAFSLAAELKNRHGFDLTAIGFVQRDRVKVVAVSGLDDVRGANPGVKLIRAVMEECLDQREPVFHDKLSERTDDDVERNYRLHAQWSHALGDKSVASLPLVLQDDIVGIVSMSYGPEAGLQRAQLLEIGESPEMTLYGALVPLSRIASRGLMAHAADLARDGWTRAFGRGTRRAVTLGVLALSLFAWLLLGQLPYGFAVPCQVKAANRRVVACPRDGVLADLYVKPGDLVRKGQLLAILDAHDDVLRKLELEAQVNALEAEFDAALATRELARLRVLKAQQATLVAQLAIAESSIKQAEIRAPQASVILNGDLREQLGSRITRGDPMFELARYDRMIVVLKVPEDRILAARDSVSVTFAPAAQPDAQLELRDLRIAPASSVTDGQNVFLAEGLAEITIEGLAPGMEGVAHVDVGYRPVWWILSHRVVQWLRLSFWL